MAAVDTMTRVNKIINSENNSYAHLLDDAAIDGEVATKLQATLSLLKRNN